MKKLRLIVTDKCNRHCAGCCNLSLDWKSIPVFKPITDRHPRITEWNEVLVTGGEPMLEPELTRKVINMISADKKAFLYTAEVSDWQKIKDVIRILDGLTVTIHDDCDVDTFVDFHSRLAYEQRIRRMLAHCRYLRLNVFRGVTLPDNIEFYPMWKIKRNIEWIPNAPLPDGEVLMRLPGVGE